MKLKKKIKKIEEQKDIIAAARNKLKFVFQELDDLLDRTYRAEEYLQSAIDSLSEKL